MIGDSQEPVEDIIICREVHKWFDDFHVLRGISLTVAKGQVIVIFGPSGSGKSTFIRTINRLEDHQKGDIIVDGIELTNDIRNIEAIRSEVGMVFQQFNLFPHLTALQNITLGPIVGSQVAQGQGRGDGAGIAGAGGHSRAGRQISGATLRRSAAASGHCSGIGHAAQDHAV